MKRKTIRAFTARVYQSAQRALAVRYNGVAFGPARVPSAEARLLPYQESGIQRGQAYIELMLILPLLLIVLAALIFFGRVLYVKIALDMASYDACRAAVESLRPDDGLVQGQTAGIETLKGFYLNPGGATYAILPQGAWQRGTWIECRFNYAVYVGDIPWLSSFFSGRGVPLQSTTWSRVETWRSWWVR